MELECWSKGKNWLRKCDVFWKRVQECWSGVRERAFNVRFSVDRWNAQYSDVCTGVVDCGHEALYVTKYGHTVFNLYFPSFSLLNSTPPPLNNYIFLTGFVFIKIFTSIHLSFLFSVFLIICCILSLWLLQLHTPSCTLHPAYDILSTDSLCQIFHCWFPCLFRLQPLYMGKPSSSSSNSLWTPSNPTSNHFFFKNNRLAKFSPLTLLFSSVWCPVS